MADAPYQALYRRFRPQRFGELRGQDHVTRALTNAVREAKVAHAYLFSGPRGTGKTSAARVLAKALNCTNLQGGEPCGACDSCVQVQLGTSLDVHELDAASNNGVDAMRDLVSRAALGTPGRWKVYIVDEVHMLSTPASNALLKTLEEPPGHVVFVLATTDPQKVLPTIRSRTQHFEFRLLRPDVLGALLHEVSKEAGLGVPAEAIDLAVRRGRGSARDALSVLDQVAAAGVDDDEVPVIDEMVEALAGRDVGRALAAVAEGCAAGRDPRRLAEDLLAQLRNAFLALMARSLVDLPDDAAVRVEEQARRLGAAGLTRSMEALGEALVDMREALDPRVSLEVALVRVARPEADASPAALLERIERLERGLSGQTAGPAVTEARQALGAVKKSATPAAPPEPPEPGSPKAKAADPPSSKAKAADPPSSKAKAADSPSPKAKVENSPSPKAKVEEGAPFPTRDDLTAAWADEVLPELTQRARARFRVGRWTAAGSGTAVFALPNAFHCDKAEDVRLEVEQALTDHFGTRVPIRLVVDDGNPGAPPVARGAVAPLDDETVDPAELDAAPPGLASPEDRLKDAFPGAEEVHQ